MRGRAVLALLLVVSVMLSAIPGLVAADVRGEPDLSATAADNTVTPGQETTLSVTLLNTGVVHEGGNPNAEQRVMTARGTTLRMRNGGAPVSIESGTVGVGSVHDGAAVPATFRISVHEDAEPGTYELPVVAEYTHTSSISNDSSTHQTQTREEVLSVRVVVSDAAQFEVVDTTTTAPVGGSGSVALRVRNVGESAAHNTTVAVQSTSGALTFGGSPSAETFAGTWEAGETRLLEYEATVAPGTERRSLALQTTATFEDEDGVTHQWQTTTGVEPLPAQEFTVENVDTTVTPGANGVLTLSLTNAENRTLKDAAVRVTSPNAALTFRGATSAQTFVGEWSPGETREVPFEVSLADGAPVRNYAVEVSAQYTDGDGNDGETQPFLVGVRPAGDQSFSLRDVQGSLRVGREGEVSATLVNDGPGAAKNAVLVLENPGQNVQAGETEYAVGDLGPGDTTNVNYELEVSSSAREGPRQFQFHLQYEDAGGETQQSDPVYLRTTVAERRPVFSVNALDATVQTGSSTTLEIEVTNNGDEPVSDVSAKLFADAPLTASDDEAFVDELPPGETRTIQFEISAAGNANGKTYPLSIDFQYDDADGDTLISDTYKVPVQVQERQGGGILSFAPIGGGLLALLLGGIVVLRQ